MVASNRKASSKAIYRRREILRNELSKSRKKNDDQYYTSLV